MSSKSSEISQIKAEIQVLKAALLRLEQRLSAVEAGEAGEAGEAPNHKARIVERLSSLSSQLALVPIWRLRQECQMNRDIFDEALWDLQAEDKILLFSGECTAATPEQWADSIVSKFGHRRFYVRLEES